MSVLKASEPCADGEANSVIRFINGVHDFERDYRLFEIRDSDGKLYWDIVRQSVLVTLYALRNPVEEPGARPVHATAGRSAPDFLRKIGKGLGLIRWWIINELNFSYHTKKKKDFVFLAVSRFLKNDGTVPMDAVADELIGALPEARTLVMESFANAKFGPIAYKKSNYNWYKLWYTKKLYRLLPRRFFAGITADSVAMGEVLRQHLDGNADWQQLIYHALLDYRIDYRHAKAIIRRTKPRMFFYSGLAKGFIRACHDAGVKAVEIQHSPLNRADISYSYSTAIDYGEVDTLPDCLLTSSAVWEEKIYYPTRFVNTGSDYFYDSTVRDSRQKQDSILIISSPNITDYSIDYAKALAGRDGGRYPVVLKLHSAEGDRLDEIRSVFAAHGNVRVIYNERTMQELLSNSFVAVMCYTSVAYQALQMGIPICIMKKAYYEGCFDLMELPGVKLVESAADIDINEALNYLSRETLKPHFFESFRKEVFIDFCTGK